MQGGDRQDGWLGGSEVLGIFLLVVSDHRAILRVYELVVAGLGLAGFDSLLNPFFELEPFGVVTAVESKLEVLLTLPKLLGSQSEPFPPLLGHVLLVVVVVANHIGDV